MKRLTKRTEIAKAMNFGEYPVLRIDLSDRDSYGLKGCKVRVDAGTFSTGERNLVNASLRVFKDEKAFKVTAGSCFLSADLSYSDFMEDLEYANAPIITADQDIVIVIYDSFTRKVFAPYMVRTGSRISPHCSTPISVEPVDLSDYFPG